MLASIGYGILSADRVLNPFAEVFCRPSRCFMLEEQVLWRATEYSIQNAETLWRPSRCSILQKQALYRASRCFLQLRKYSVARQDALFCRSKYYDGRQDAFSNCGNTLSAVRVPYPVEASILSAVRVLPQKEEASCRPSGCFLEYKNSCFAN